MPKKKWLNPEKTEYESKHIKKNLIVIFIRPRLVSYRGESFSATGKRVSESTGSSTGSFSLRTDKTQISPRLKKYLTKEPDKWIIRLPKGQYMKLTMISKVRISPAWERHFGISDLIITSQKGKL